jgi:putative endonuclease
MDKYYTYVLKSLADNKFYTGFTKNIDRRLKEHNEGKVISTKYRVPLVVVYYEACFNEQDALHREKYLKSTYGKRYIRNRIKNFLNN